MNFGEDVAEAVMHMFYVLYSSRSRSPRRSSRSRSRSRSRGRENGSNGADAPSSSDAAPAAGENQSAQEA